MKIFKKIFVLFIIFYVFILINFSSGYATFIDWDSIINGETTLKQEIEPKKTNTTNTGNNMDNVNKHKLNLITTFNKGFIDKYNKDLENIKKYQEIISQLQQKSEQEKQKEYMKYGILLKKYNNIEKNINNADYIILLKFNVNNINYFDYNGSKYIFYIKPFIFENYSKNKKFSNIDKEIKNKLNQILQINDIVELKKQLEILTNKYKLANISQIISLNKINDFFKFKLGRSSQTLFDIKLENLTYYNSLYYIPNSLNKYIVDKNYVYFYFPVSKKNLENIVDNNIDTIDFNKFYCAKIKYSDSFYYMDKIVCNFIENSKDNKIIELNMDNTEVLQNIKLKIVDRGNEIIDIIIIIGGIILAVLLFYFLKYLKTKRHQHEQDIL